MAQQARDRRQQRFGLLTERDEWALRWIGDQYAARRDRLSQLLSATGQPISAERVRQIVQKWKSAGLVEAQRIRVGEPGWVWLTGHGARAVGSEWRARRPALHLLRHIDAVARVRLVAERSWDARGWVSERKLFRDEPHGIHVPDGVWLTADGGVAVEVELTLKSTQRTAAILAELGERWPRVLYVAGSPTIARSVESLAVESGLTGRVAVMGLQSLEVPS